MINVTPAWGIQTKHVVALRDDIDVYISIKLFYIVLYNRDTHVYDNILICVFCTTEVVGAVVSVLVIWVVTGILVYLAVLRIINQDYTINADIMLITAGASVGVNVL